MTGFTTFSMRYLAYVCKIWHIHGYCGIATADMTLTARLEYLEKHQVIESPARVPQPHGFSVERVDGSAANCWETRSGLARPERFELPTPWFVAAIMF